MKVDFDIVIMGAGMVGTTLALALSHLPLRIALIESKPVLASPPSPPGEDRPLSLTLGSSRILKSLGLWEALAFEAIPINEVHITHRGYFGAIRLRALECQVPCLGYTVPSKRLGYMLYKQVLNLASKKKESFALFDSAQVKEVAKNSTHWEISFRNSENFHTYSTHLVIGADGTDSILRHLVNIPTELKESDQSALVTRVDTSRFHRNIAYERFTSEGILAFLPGPNFKTNIVWTGKTKKMEALALLPPEIFVEKVQALFGFRLGNFSQVEDLSIHKIKKIWVEQQIQPGLVLLGNSAHTLSPLAAQGLNLALQDLAELVQVISEVMITKQKLGDYVVLEKYQEKRRDAQRRIFKFTEHLETLFDIKGLGGAVRQSGIGVMEMLPCTKKYLVQQLIGMKGRMNWLNLGLDYTNIIKGKS